MTKYEVIGGRIGFTGHQGLTRETEKVVTTYMRSLISEMAPSVGLCSLAEGADQIFAELLLASGAELTVVVPCRGYERTFTDSQTLNRYQELLTRAKNRIELNFPSPSEDAYWAAGKRVVQESDRMIAVWDGLIAQGKGGTGDIVAYAKKLGRDVEIIWPDGSARK